ncbi:MAG TPA: DUF937 domain-containing protein [Sphingobacteriaceae bacterium]|nr:DUF937 domain-containing protein [Sphingobacteriaceae bacterium]
MNNILALLNGGLGKEVIDSISKEAGASKKDTQSVVTASLPALFGALQNNARSGGAGGILQAISTKHDGSILNNLSGALGAGAATDGAGILKHVLGSNLTPLQKSISEKTGVPAATVGKVLALLAPIVMGFLGRETKKGAVKNEKGLTDLLGGLVGGGSVADLLGSLLGGANTGGKSKSKTGGLGGLLGGLGGLLGKK